MDETWRGVLGYPGYRVSTRGRVASPRGNVLRGTVTRDGAVQVYLKGPLGPCYRRVHNLVAAAFLGPRPPGAVVRHKSSDRRNNAVGELAFAPSRRRTHRALFKAGEANVGAKLAAEQVRWARARRQSGVLLRELAADLGVAVSTVHRAVTGRAWGQLGPAGPTTGE